MLHTKKIVGISITALLSGLSSMAQAGSILVFDFAAAALPPALPVAGPVEAVPVLSDILLIALGLFLVVVAVRTLKSNRAYQKYLSIAILAGGLVIGGLGTERSLAGVIASFTFGEEEGDLGCDGVTGLPYSGGASVTNSCGFTAEVTPRVIGPAAVLCIELAGDGDCNTLADGGTCTLDSYQYIEPLPDGCEE